MSCCNWSSIVFFYCFICWRIDPRYFLNETDQYSIWRKLWVSSWLLPEHAKLSEFEFVILSFYLSLRGCIVLTDSIFVICPFDKPFLCFYFSFIILSYWRCKHWFIQEFVYKEYFIKNKLIILKKIFLSVFLLFCILAQIRNHFDICKIIVLYWSCKVKTFCHDLSLFLPPQKCFFSTTSLRIFLISYSDKSKLKFSAGFFCK